MKDKVQRQVNIWLRVVDRPQWESLRQKGIPPSEILSQGIQLLYQQEVTNAKQNVNDIGKEPDDSR